MFKFVTAALMVLGSIAYAEGDKTKTTTSSETTTQEMPATGDAAPAADMKDMKGKKMTKKTMKKEKKTTEEHAH